ncbi:MAG: siderophore-interacting protein [Actinomycetaceae bacterium]|nr:siderophore-interacting protein [Actinomycetaceae bacterium]
MQARVLDLEVVGSCRISPGFQRVTLQPVDAAAELDDSGFDQWFRMFFAPPGRELHPPYGPVEGWYQRLRAMPEEDAPHIRNYTIRARRRVGRSWQIDVDFVLHGTGGEAGGAPADGRQASEPTGGHRGGDYTAAAWAVDARPGDRIAFLDQGPLFRPEPGPQLIVTDPTGIPGLEAIVRTLARTPQYGGWAVRAIAEVDDEADVRELACVDVEWVLRHPDQAPGGAALEALRSADVDAGVRAYITGESDFVLTARADLRERGVPKSAIDFCGYWRRGKKATDE